MNIPSRQVALTTCAPYNNYQDLRQDGDRQERDRTGGVSPVDTSIDSVTLTLMDACNSKGPKPSRRDDLE